MTATATAPAPTEAFYPGSDLWHRDEAHGPRHTATGDLSPQGVQAELVWLNQQVENPQFDWLAHRLIAAAERLKRQAKRAQLW